MDFFLHPKPEKQSILSLFLLIPFSKYYSRSKLMYSELPQDLQQKVQELLVAGNFTSAKDMHDNWLVDQKA